MSLASPENIMESSNPKTKNSSSTFHTVKTVSLKEWWLVKSENEVEGKTLAVAGLTSSGLGAVRVFSSSTIIKRYDVFTLETADGVHIVFNGFIDKPRTCENGFSSEVFKDFLFGFPPNWEKYATGILGRACATMANQERNSSFESGGKMNIGCREESPSKGTNVVSESTTSIVKDEIIQQNSAADSLKSANEKKFKRKSSAQTKKKIKSASLQMKTVPSPQNEDDNTTHSVICKKSLNATLKECISGIIPTKGPNLQNHVDISTTIPSPQKENHHNVMPTPVSTSNSFDTESINPTTSLSGKLRKSKVKSQKGKQGEVAESTPSIVKDKIIQQNSAADSLKDANKKKLSAQSKKKNKSASPSKEGTKKKLQFDNYSSPLSRGEKKSSIVSPESMNLKRSRSGRLLLPSLEFWRNQKANYDRHGQITAIQDGL